MRRSTLLPIARLALAAAALSLAGVPLGAAQARALTDRDAERVLPVLRADVAALAGGLSAIMPGLGDPEGEERFAAAIENGGVDPLGWIREQSAHAVVPQWLRYDRACSRDANANWTGSVIWDRSGTYASLRRTPTAVHTYGLPRAPDHAADDHPARRAILEAVKRTITFLEARGFTEIRDPESPGNAGSRQHYWYALSPDRQLLVSFQTHNTFLFQQAGPGCTALGEGPIAYYQLVRFGHEVPDPATALQAALREAGMEMEEYFSIYAGLLLARDVTRDTTMLTHVPGAAIVRRNLDVYRRHAAVLDPLLDAMVAHGR
jgi:hypothetical protein